MGYDKQNKTMKKADLIKTLMESGWTKAIAEKIAANTPDDAPDTPAKDITKMVTDFKAAQRELLENDAEFVEGIEAAVKGKERGVFTRKMKQKFGLTAEEVKDKAPEELIDLAHEKATKSKDKTVQELQEENAELTKINKKLLEEDIPAKDKEKEEFKKGLLKESALTKQLAGKKLTVSLEDAAPTIINGLNSKYDVDIDKDGKITLFQKGTLGTDKPLKVKNADGTGFLSADEAIETDLKKFKWLEQSNGGKGKGKEGDGVIVDGKKKKGEGNEDEGGSGGDVNPYISKAQQHLEAQKKQMAENSKKKANKEEEED